MSFLSYLSNSYRSLSYQNKLLLSYFVFIMIPLLFLSIFSYQQSSAVITDQTRLISQMYLDQARSDLNSQLGQMTGLAQQLARQKRIRNILEQDPAKMDISSQYDDLNELNELTTRLLAPENIRQVRLYVNDGFLYSNRKILTYSLAELANAAWFDPEKSTIGSSFLTEPYSFSHPMQEAAELVSAVSLIRSGRDYNQMVGLVTVDCEKAELLAILDRVDFSGQGRAYILDGMNKVICGWQSSDKTSLDDFTKEDLQHLVNNKSDCLTAFSGLTLGGWRIMVIDPIKPLLASAFRLRIQLISFAILDGVND